MSLLVWLPMTKDLTQQGISDITVSNVGVTLNTNGKLGKCYYFDGNAHYLQFSKSVGDLYSGDFSYAVWLKPTDDTRSIICSEYSASGASGIAFELTASRQIRLYWNGSPDIYATGCVLPKDVWTHCAITRSGNVAKFYMNGILTYTYEGTLANKTSTANIRLGDDYRGGTSVTYMGYMNDFRLYNHCLSAKEVEILSRGLVCHYPLNGNGRNGDNLVPNQSQFTSVNPKVLTTTTIDGYSLLSGSAFEIKPSTTYTLSVYCDGQIATKHATDGSEPGTFSIWLYLCIDGTTKDWRNGGYDNPICFASTNFNHKQIGQRHIWQYTTSSNHRYMSLRINNYGPGTITNKFWGFKIEEGSVATSYIPNSSETTYSTMGYDSGIEYDVSGNGNNGVKNNITYNSNTARYSICSKFDGSSTRISFSDIYVGNEWSYGLWVKAPQSTTRGWENVVMLNETGSDSDTQLSFWLNLKANGCQSTANKQYNSTITYPNDGNWHHFFATFDGSNLKTYIDGLLVNTKAITNTWFQRTHLTIGAVRTGDNTYNFYSLCNLSDFRLYSTALSATQVAELYNTAVSVANNGTLLGYELVEV